MDFVEIPFLANKFFNFVFSVITNHENIMYVSLSITAMVFNKRLQFFSYKAAMKIIGAKLGHINALFLYSKPIIKFKIIIF